VFTYTHHTWVIVGVIEMSTEKTDEISEQYRLRAAAFWMAVAAVVGAGLVFGFTIFVISQQFVEWQTVLKEHFGAIIGLPGAAAVAFVLVVFLRQTEGPIEFEGFGFKLKGAAGQILMWVAPSRLECGRRSL
jgi:hypothetical protein